MSEQMTKEEAIRWFQDRLNEWCHYPNRETQKAYKTAISALRGEQPCPKCAEWEKAWENMSHRLFVKYGRGFLQETIDAFDPRRKQAEEPTQRRDDGERRM